MQTVRTGEDLAFALFGGLKRSGTVALVPTMGALHSGHMALIRAAKAEADSVITTIFVNPTQFGEAEDLARYPRQEAQDEAMLADAGCDLLWLPSAAEIYPAEFATKVTVGGVSERWEGEHRPGHFDGVATVVARLLMLTRPDFVVFGQKDYQQLAVIRRMSSDLNLPGEIVAVPTVRDQDGLALSSRNAYLSADERARALALPRSLEHARDAIAGGEPVARALDAARQALRDAGFASIDYLALVDADTLEPVENADANERLIAAAVIGSTRLIDNVAFGVNAIRGR